MVINGNWNGWLVTVSVKPNCLTVSIEAHGDTQVYSYDYAGRLWTALVDRLSYRRGLDGKMVAKWQAEGGERQRRWLLPEEARQVEEQARQRMRDLYLAIQSQSARLDVQLPDLGVLGFERLIAFDTQASQADIARYFQVYKPVGILPPDQYFAVVLQATEGCSFNTCTFCDFYRDRPFRIKTPDEFRTHAQAVRQFLGDGLSLRRTIFLGDANALTVPMSRLLPLIEVVHDSYDVESLGGIYAFLDGFSAQKKSHADYRLLAQRGLKRVYIGMESGNEALLKFLKKPGKPVDAIEAVKAIKDGGVAVGVIILLGAGGQAYIKAHVKDTIQALNAMRLELDDLIYFSELFVSNDMPYLQDAYQAQLQPLSPEERIAQGDEIEAGLKFSPKGGTPHISRYDIREFVY